ncbi:MAG: DUF6596 domain-containing protein, partial [Myxococcota bacterium]
RETWASRLGAVLDAIYAAFARGFDLGALPEEAAQAADRHLEALHLAEVVAALLPDEPEALGLLALFCHVDARRRARQTASGDFVPLDEQDPVLWNASRIEQAETALRRAAHHAQLGRYQLEAAIQSCHVARHRDGVDNDAETVQLYEALVGLTGTVGAALGHAAAVGRWRGAEAGLACLERLRAKGLDDHQPWWAVRAELLSRADAPGADAAYGRAIALTQDAAARRWLEQRRHRSR